MEKKQEQKKKELKSKLKNLEVHENRMFQMLNYINHRNDWKTTFLFLTLIQECIKLSSNFINILWKVKVVLVHLNTKNIKTAFTKRVSLKWISWNMLFSNDNDQVCVLTLTSQPPPQFTPVPTICTMCVFVGW